MLWLLFLWGRRAEGLKRSDHKDDKSIGSIPFILPRKRRRRREED
jgi:hypothetical protein